MTEPEYIEQPDGTTWFFTEALNVWRGFKPGEDKSWNLTPEEYEERYGSSSRSEQEE